MAGRFGTSTSLETIGSPYLKHVGLSKSEKEIFKRRLKHLDRMKEDEDYKKRHILKLQLRATNNTNSPRSKKLKKEISLPKFSWDKATQDQDTQDKD